MTDDTKARSSEGPTSERYVSVNDYVKFGAAIVAAKGEWIEIDIDKDPLRGTAAYTAAQRGVAYEVVELTRRDGILYGRMRTP